MTAPTFFLPTEVLWSLSALHEAIPLLAERSSLLSGAGQDRTALRTEIAPPPLPDDGMSREGLTSWLENTGQRLGLEVVEVETTYPDQENLLLRATPALLLLPEEGGLPGSFVLLVSSRRRTLRLLQQDGSLYRLPVHRLRDILVRALEAPLRPMVDTILEQVNIRKQQRERVRRALFREYLAGARVEGCWMLRLPPSASFIHQLRRARFPGKLVGLVCATLAARLLVLMASFLIGKTILQGNVELGDFQLWGLLLCTVIPMHLIGMQIKNRLSLQFGVLLRNRLLHGILQLRPEEIQHQGSGYFVGNVQEIEQLEAMGMSTAFMACTSFLEVLIAAVVLMQGAGGLLHGMLLLGWTGVIFLLGWMYYLRMRDWLIHSRVMTCDLVERMVGHRTRLAQERSEQLHEREDQLLSRYALLSECRVTGGCVRVPQTGATNDF
ncbi:MAG: ABC transporter ATP-binding protein [Candidatus Electrothrix sp. AR5]|nr:ABC transporter ATP-binding protein [Candidatus Electrothrix sp. AR5]